MLSLGSKWWPAWQAGTAGKPSACNARHGCIAFYSIQGHPCCAADLLNSPVFHLARGTMLAHQVICDCVGHLHNRSHISMFTYVFMYILHYDFVRELSCMHNMSLFIVVTQLVRCTGLSWSSSYRVFKYPRGLSSVSHTPHTSICTKEEMGFRWYNGFHSGGMVSECEVHL